MKSEPDDKLALLADSSDRAIANLAEKEIQRRRDKKAQDDSDRKEDVRQKLEAQKLDREASRFHIQFAETRRQNYWTRFLSVGALLVAAGSLVVSICALSSRKEKSPQLAPQVKQPEPASLLPVTNATPSNPEPPTPAKPAGTVESGRE